MRSRRLAQARFAKGGKLTLWRDAGVPAPSVALGTRREPIVPLVSSGVPGPLGLVHLPRMWLAGILDATGRMAPAFRAGSPLFDDLVCRRIGLEPAAVAAFLATPPLPDYLTFERWVAAHARSLDAQAIAQVNNAVAKAQLDGRSLVLRDDERAWDAVHAFVVAYGPAGVEPIVPAISSRTAGALGVDHLPRLWLKNTLKTFGALPVGYRAGAVRVVTRGLAFVSHGIDTHTYERLALDRASTVRFVEAERPRYAAFEDYVRAHAQRLDPASVALHNSVRSDTRPEKAVTEKAYAGWDDGSRFGYLIDDLIDWKLIFDVVTGAPIPAWTGP